MTIGFACYEVFDALMATMPRCQEGKCDNPSVGYTGGCPREAGSRSSPACLEHADWQPCPWNEEDGGPRSKAISQTLMCDDGVCRG